MCFPPEFLGFGSLPAQRISSGWTGNLHELNSPAKANTSIDPLDFDPAALTCHRPS